MTDNLHTTFLLCQQLTYSKSKQLNHLSICTRHFYKTDLVNNEPENQKAQQKQCTPKFPVQDTAYRQYPFL